MIASSVRDRVELVRALPREFREAVLREAEAMREEAAALPEVAPEDPGRPSIWVTSFEGAKGLSAHHVFIAGIHDRELPRNARNIQDLEVCKFLVALTRTRKQCHVMYTRRFGNVPRRASVFIRWVGESRLHRIRVDRNYWKVPF